METRKLGEPEFLATYAAPMANVTADPGEAIDVWPYVDAVPDEDLEGHEVWDHFVEYVYRSADDLFDHVLVMTRTKDVYLAVVVDRRAMTVYGHRLLDLPKEYGL